MKPQQWTWVVVASVAALWAAGWSAHAQAARAAFVAVDTATAAGLAYTGETWNARRVDSDRDGWPDLWLGLHDQGGRLMHNNRNGTYIRVAAGAWPKFSADGTVPDRHDCNWADFDKNGLVDAYCTAGRGANNAVKVGGRINEVWLQTSVNAFRKVGAAMGAGDPCARSQYAATLDANGDGWTDVFVGNAAPAPVAGDPCDDPTNGLPDEASKLFVNQAGRSFVNASAAFGIRGNMGGPCLQAIDFDRDGWTDLMACSRPGIVFLHNNAGTGFTDVSATMGITTGMINEAAMGDLNRDGRPDLITVTEDQVSYRLGTATGLGVARRIVATSAGRDVAIGDADGDGSRDVYLLRGSPIGTTNPNDVILLNRALVFTPLAVPAAGGMGDAVAAVDANRDGRTEFVVLNGLAVAGPLQLISLVGAGRTG